MRSCDTGQRIPCFDSCQLTTTWMCNIRLRVPILARKCEISHWLFCGAEEQVEGWTDRRLHKISRMDITKFSLLWGSCAWSSAIIDLFVLKDSVHCFVVKTVIVVAVA